MGLIMIDHSKTHMELANRRKYWLGEIERLEKLKEGMTKPKRFWTGIDSQIRVAKELHEKAGQDLRMFVQQLESKRG